MKIRLKTNQQLIKLKARARRVKASIGLGTPEKPRLAIKRSLNHIYGQLIDDVNRKTIVASSDYEINEKAKTTKVQKAFEVGKILGKKALDKKITSIIYDRKGYKYHGRVKAFADGAREAGLKF